MVAFRHLNNSPVNRLGWTLTAGRGFYLTSRHRFGDGLRNHKRGLCVFHQVAPLVERESAGTQTTVYGFIAISGCLREFDDFYAIGNWLSG